MARGPEVKVRIGADTKGLERGLGSANTMLSRFGGAAGIARAAGAALGVSVVATGAAMVAMTRHSLDAIDANVKLARSLGLSNNAFQAMAMVAKEAGVEQGRLASMLGLMQRNMDELRQGTQAQVDAFGRLGVSISDLKDLSPDQQFALLAEKLNGVKDPAERTALAMQTLGRSGRDAINMIEGYSAKLDEARAFQERFGVAVSQTSAEGVERANDAVGRLSMVMEGLGNRMAVAVAPALERTANALVDLAARALGTKTTLEDFFGTLDRARIMLGEETFRKMADDLGLVLDNRDNLDAFGEALLVVFSNAAQAELQMRSFAANLDSVGALPAAELMRRLADETRQLHKDFADGKITRDEFLAGIRRIGEQADKTVGHLGDVNAAKFDGVIGRLGALTGAMSAAAAMAGRLAASLPGGGGPSFPGKEKDDLGGPVSSLAPSSSVRPGRQSVDSFGNFAGGGKGAGGGGGGGGGKAIKDLFAERLEALQEGLATEQEVIAEWYNEGLTTLQAALEQKKITEEEYTKWRERLEQEHQERLGRIREMGNQWGVQAALEGGAEILNAVGQTNRKALKMAKIFSAAQALISTYEGAAKELKKGTFGFASAAAVIAKGIGFVSAIKGVNEGGGGSSGGGGGTSTAVPQVTETRTANINFYGGFQPTQETIGMIASGLNDWLGDGGRLRVGGAV